MSAVFQRAGISVQVPAPAFYRVRLNVLAEPHLLLDWVVLRVHKFGALGVPTLHSTCLGPHALVSTCYGCLTPRPRYGAAV